MSYDGLHPKDLASFIERLRVRLAGELPGREAQLSMAPANRRDPSPATKRDTNSTEAAVLIALLETDHRLSVLLTVRRDDLKEHPGQVSFPGGRREPNESREETALREAREEVNLNPTSVDMLGRLTPLYIPPTNYCVHPFVGTVNGPFDLQAQQAEVASILFAPLPFLLNATSIRHEAWTVEGRSVRVPYFALDNYKIWGATAMMLAEFTAACSDVLDPSI